MTSTKTIYIATWGNPLSWDNVEYACDGEDDAVRSGRARGYSSMVCINRDKVDRYVIYVVDSVITVSTQPKNNDAYEVLKSLKQDGKVQLREEGGGEGKLTVMVEPTSGNYDKVWRSIVEEYVRRLANRWGINDDKLRVVITSTMGKYYGINTWIYNSYPDLMMMELIHELWSAINDVVNEDEHVKVILDVTHGINFMPTLTLFATRLAASLALLKGVDEVIIKVFNAMPQTWNYIKVFSERVRTIVLPEGPSSPVVKAFSMGLPIIVHKLCGQRSKGKGHLQGVNVRIEVRRDDEGGKEVMRVDYRGVRGKYMDYYEEALEDLICGKSRNKLYALMSDASKLYSKVNEVVGKLVINELNNLSNAIQRSGKLVKDKVLYAELLGEEFIKCGSGERDEVFERNAIAHAGLLKDCTYVEKCDDDYCLDVDDVVLNKLGLRYKQA